MHLESQLASEPFACQLSLCAFDYHRRSNHRESVQGKSEEDWCGLVVVCCAAGQMFRRYSFLVDHGRMVSEECPVVYRFINTYAKENREEYLWLRFIPRSVFFSALGLI